MSKVIRNGTVVTADRTWKADVLVEGETIKAIGEGLKGDEEIDATDAYVIPGGIDPHTHLEMPFMGTTAAETFESGTFAAASGGTTMLVDFVLPGPDGSLLTALDEWDRKSKPQICVDIGYHMAITGWDERIWREMDAVVKRGVNTFKHFMAYKGALMVEDDEMFASFKRCAELGALPLVHAENGDIVAALQEKYMAEGLTGPEGHAYSRPPEVEGEAANRAVMIADAAGVPLYIVHVSCEQAHEAIRRARAKGMRVYGEPLIQHLTLDETEYFNKDWDYAARRVMSPPFRDKAHQDSLWAGLQSGSLQVVATDHAAFTTEQKRMGVKGFPSIPNGTGGLEERLAVLVDQGGGDRAADAERVRGGDLVEHREDPQRLPEEGGDRRRGGRGPRGVGSEGVEDGVGGHAEVDHRLQRLRGHDRDGAGALHAQPRRRGLGGGAQQPAAAGAGQVRAEAGVLGAAPGAVGVEGAQQPAEDRAGSDQHPVRGVMGFGAAEAAAFDAAAAHAKAYRAAVPVRSALSYSEVMARFAEPVPERGIAAREVVDELARKAEGGLMGMVSPNFHGWVIGASHPAGVAADWLTSAWGQAGGFADPTPAAAAVEEVAAGWVLDLLGLPAESGVGFATGATMANFTALAAARNELLRRAGWDVEAQGLFGAPEVHVVVGGETHSSVFLTLRLLGFGAERVHVAASDDQGRMRADALGAVLDGLEGPIVVCLQAGNVCSGAFDPFGELVPLARAKRAWVHVDGAFGLWACAAPGLRHLTAGVEAADSWAADAHKWLQVPYDCGLAMVRDAGALQRAMSITASYLPSGENRAPEAFSPEMSRRARGFAVWAVLKALGRDGVAEMVERHCAVARHIAGLLDAEPGLTVLNEVVLNQVALACGEGEDGDRLTKATLKAVQADGVCYPSHGRWRGREIIRVSVSAGPTTVEDGTRTAEAIVAAWRRVRAA